MTINYYQQHAQAFFSDTIGVDMASLYAPFIAHLAPGACVLDAGCGSGRDARAFVEMGYAVEAFDASSEMVRMATEHSGLPVKQMTFNEVEACNRYDGIWCCASLLHVPAQELPQVMSTLAQALKSGGIWYVSFKYGDSEREKGGRHFSDLTEAGLNALVAQLTGIRVQSMWTTQDKRPDRSETWLNALLRKD
ncbi:class I SAM-dependent methyltransferase [Phytobacter sp. V91]|uniref:class I SAM-dependent methyltransferase n=1 Tax=Phytobacter sp. V91 TaxID=3369425 RepID=UPI003F6443F4